MASWRIVPYYAVLAGLVLFGAAQSAPAGDSFDQARRRWEAARKPAELGARARAHDAFASSDDTRAVPLLAKAYRELGPDEDQERYLLASIVTARCRRAEHLPAYVAWRRRCDRSRDAWLWYKSLRVDAYLGRLDAVEQAARSAPSPWLRAAALEVLADAQAERAPELALEVLRELPAKQMERALLIESVASIAQACEGRRHEEQMRLVLTKLIRQLDAKKTLPRTRLAIARRLQHIFKTEELHYDARGWLRHLLGRPSPGPVEDGRYAPPKKTYFFGLPATGRRIAYVIDTSSSMFVGISPDELEQLKKIRRPQQSGEVTGRSGRAGAGRGRKQKPADRLPWEEIHTRYDAARECLKFSLQGLRADQYFSILRFATDAGFFPRSSGMVPATRANVRSALRALDAVGQDALGGATNMHAGLHRAYKVHAQGMTGPGEYVDVRAFREGCDTVFLLSDGEPCADDWSGTATGTYLRPPASTWFGLGRAAPRFGNYWTPYQLCDDLKRLNLFRKAEIHCIGIGQPNMDLLQLIAAIGNGRAVQVGDAAGSWGRVAALLRASDPATRQIEKLRTGGTERERMGAAESLARLHSLDGVPALIDALDDISVRVRAAAQRALQGITGHSLPYDATSDFDKRRGAQRAWRAWFAANERALRKRSKPPRAG